MTKKILIDEAVVKQAIWTLERLGEASDTDVSPKKWYEALGWPTLEALEAAIADQKAAQANNEVVNALAEQPDYSICPTCGGMATDPIVPVDKVAIMQRIVDSQTGHTRPVARELAKRAAAPTQQPVLVRDLAEILGATVPEVCDALAECGGPRRSTNMAVSGEEALAVAAKLKQAAELVTDEENEQFSEDVSNFKGADPEATKFALEQFLKRRGMHPAPTQQDGTNGVVALQPLTELWEMLPGYLIDKYEGETLTEELLQQAMAELLRQIAHHITSTNKGE